ncbi:MULTISPECIES: plasmid partitioning protein RepA [unclassified Xanthobacter]|uniref:plasmid partitioning protein RepA n=1 Tax=unclassified Xanthobacter TaxID=2623496 RepID=UPI001F29279E|nr:MULTISPECIES: plasmid partitioning protein RepA [unclassified Xanthobacter]
MYEVFGADGRILSEKLNEHRLKMFPPLALKQMRGFSTAEAARLIGVHDGYLRKLMGQEGAPQPETLPGGRKLYSLQVIQGIREYLSLGGNRQYVRHRAGPEHLQVLAVVNFKGGSGKTTTSAHLAQYLAMQGYRVLGVDLDPQASFSAMLGYQPEYDVQAGDSLYGAVQYVDEQRAMSEVIRRTYFPGLDMVPGSQELMEFEHETPKVLASGPAFGDYFFVRVANALSSVADDYDVVVMDCPPSLGYLTLSALCAATGIIVPVHPQMLDVLSMSQFLQTVSALMSVVGAGGAKVQYDFMRYLITRLEPQDGPQLQMMGFMRGLPDLADRVLKNPVLKSTAIADAQLTNQTLYEVERSQFNKATYDRALNSLNDANGEIEELIRKAWGRV